MLLCLSVILAFAQSWSGAVGDPNVAALTRLEAEWNDAHVRGDAAALSRLLADDLVVVVPGMRPMTKTDSLSVFTSGQMKFDRYESSDTQIRVYDATAVVTGRIRRARTMPNRSIDDDWRFTKVYVRQGNRWQVVSFHASNATP